jgi:hypothetical protein
MAPVADHRVRHHRRNRPSFLAVERHSRPLEIVAAAGAPGFHTPRGLEADSPRTKAFGGLEPRHHTTTPPHERLRVTTGCSFLTSASPDGRRPPTRTTTLVREEQPLHVLELLREPPEPPGRDLPALESVQKSARAREWNPTQQRPSSTGQFCRDLSTILHAATPGDEIELLQTGDPALHRRDRGPQLPRQINHRESRAGLQKPENEEKRRTDPVTTQVSSIRVPPVPETIDTIKNMVYFLFHSI